MNGIHFLRPNFLFLIIPFLLLIFFLAYKHHQSSGAWQHICSKDLIPYVLSKKDKKHYLTYWLGALTLSLLIFGLSGPAWEQISQPLVKQKNGLVIAIDLSPSMDAQDIKPSRLQRAIYKISDILDKNKGESIALLVFTDEPFVVTPLTDDIQTIKNLLPALETKIMPSSGHRVNFAIAKAANLLKQSGINHGSVLLITSDLTHHELEASIAIAKQENVSISVLAAATEEATPIPQAGGGFVKNASGALVMASVSKKHLTDLALSTGGFFSLITVDDADLIKLRYGHLSAHDTSMGEKTDLKQNQWHDQGYLFVLLALPFAALIFRRGILLSLLFLFPHSIQAASLKDFWKTQDQQAYELYEEEKYQEAGDLFQNRDWQAACHYKLGDFEKASQLYQEYSQVEGLYNYGTARAKLGDYKEALESYEKVLKLQPNHEDALYNKHLIEEHLKQNPQNDQQNDKQNKDKDKSKSNQDKQSQKDKQSEKGDSEEQQDEGQGNEQGQQDDGQDQNQESGNSKNSKKDSADKSENQANQNKQNSKNDDQSDSQSQSSEDNKKDIQKLEENYRDQVGKELEKERSRQDKEQESIEKSENNLEYSDEQLEEDPQKHIDERWLKRINDDPSGLLRRKFQQQYRQQQKGK